jgi:hypothetical protein
MEQYRELLQKRIISKGRKLLPKYPYISWQSSENSCPEQQVNLKSPRCLVMGVSY